MEHDYSVEKLCNVFSEHAEMADRHQKFVNEVFVEQNPGQEIPVHMGNPFNIAKALSVMADEIAKLKEQMRELYTNRDDVA